MAESVAPDGAELSPARRRWLLVGAAIGRVGRWLIFGVVLAAVPTAISMAFLPKTSSATSLLAHGDFAVLATAIGGASIGELLGPDEPPKWLRNILVSSCMLLLLSATLVLAVIAGNSNTLSINQKVNYSWLLFIISIVAGTASMGLTIHRPPQAHQERADKEGGTLTGGDPGS